MSQEVLTGAFNGLPFSNLIVNLFDFGAGAVSQWTAGNTIIQPLGVQPPLGERWNILGWAITFEGMMHFSLASPRYGKLGRVIGGLVRGAITDPTNSNPMTPLPGDASLLTTLWDGDTDSAWPTLDPVTLVVARDPIYTFMGLQAPLELLPGQQLSIGMWLTPSLTAATERYVTNARWDVYYDDGNPPLSQGQIA